MKAISLYQPWASLWLSPRKIHETRPMVTQHRGQLLVHASLRFAKDHSGGLANILRDEFGADWYKTLPTGAIIGVLNIVDCFPAIDVLAYTPDDADELKCGNFSPERFAWKRGDDFTVFKTPVPYRGQQGMFYVADEMVPEAV